MMNFGGWFFLAASESISVLNHQYTLPGIGSYVAAAILAKNCQSDGEQPTGDHSSDGME